MDFAAERAECQRLFQAISDCNLVEPCSIKDGVRFFLVSGRIGPPEPLPENTIFERFFDNEWLPNRDSGYEVLAFDILDAFSAICPDFDFWYWPENENGPDENILCMLDHFSRRSYGQFIPTNTSCTVNTQPQTALLRFELNSRVNEIHLNIDESPENELRDAINAILDRDQSTSRRFIFVRGRHHPLPEDTKFGTIFANPKKVKKAAKLGIFWL